MKKYKVKICGTTSIEDARMAIDAGADYLGVLVNVPISERSLTIEQAKAIVASLEIPVLILLYGLNVIDIIAVTDIIKPYGIHLLGQTSFDMVKELKAKLSCKIWLTVYLPARGQDEVDVNSIKNLMKNYENAGADVIVIDTVKVVPNSGIKRYGGTGAVADWDIAKELVRTVNIPVFLAGGINPDNVKSALMKVDPYGVDLASGVESAKCKRDPEKVKKLMQAVLSASEEKYARLSEDKIT
ncbi:MAG: phosphoribosylanthranilate isomerase [bacterium]